MPLFDYDEKIELGEVVDFLMQEDVSSHVTGLSICQVNITGSKDPIFVKDADEIREINVLDFLIRKDDKGEVHPLQGENVTMTLTRDKGLPIVLYFRTMDNTPDIYYTRVYSMVSGTNTFDDKRVEKGRNLPRFHRLTLAYRTSKADITPWKEFYEKTETELLQCVKEGKVVEDNTHLALYRGVYGMGPASYSFGYANWMLQQNRYYDALIYFKRVLNTLNEPAKNINHGDFYSLLNRNIAKCLMGSFDPCAAYHYYEVARFFNSDIEYEENQMFALVSDYRSMLYMGMNLGNLKEKELTWLKQTYDQAKIAMADRASKDLPYLSIGFIFSQLLRIRKENILSMVICRHNDCDFSCERTDNYDEIWNERLSEILQDNTTAVFSYSRHYKQCGLKDDKSILCYDGCIIMHVSAIPKTELARIDIMIPSFTNDADMMSLQDGITPQYKSFIVAMKPYEYDFSQSLHEINSSVASLSQNFQIMEALVGSLHTFRMLIAKYNGLTDDEKMACKEAAAETGFCFMELMLPDVAEYYLRLGMGAHNVEYLTEYVNCLVNTKDVRSMSIINKLLLQHVDTDENTRNFLHAFLKRRKAYTLIDWGMIDEAKLLLEEIINDPLCSEYAAGELMYIAKIYGR